MQADHFLSVHILTRLRCSFRSAEILALSIFSFYPFDCKPHRKGFRIVQPTLQQCVNLFYPFRRELKPASLTSRGISLDARGGEFMRQRYDT